jgi:predicted Zn finger-like uncharacterized protein
MLIVCPKCASSYDVQPGKLGRTGRSVRCARCTTTWYAMAPIEASASRMADADAAVTAAAAEPAEGGDFSWTFKPDVGGPPAARNADPGDAALEDWPDEGAGDTGSPDDADRTLPATIADAPSLAPVLDGEIVSSEDAQPGIADNIESRAARRTKRAPKRRKGLRRPSLSLIAVAMAAVLGGLLLWRKQVVLVAPQTASLYEAIGLPVNLRGLVFEGVKITREAADGVTVLVIEGHIANVTSRTVEVPRLRFGVRNLAGLEVYAWTVIPPGSVLPAGESMEFRSRLASPPADTRDIVVRFFNRRDIVSAGR